MLTSSWHKISGKFLKLWTIYFFSSKIILHSFKSSNFSQLMIINEFNNRSGSDYFLKTNNKYFWANFPSISHQIHKLQNSDKDGIEKHYKLKQISVTTAQFPLSPYIKFFWVTHDSDYYLINQCFLSA